jgi:hypothetical protein
MKRKSSKMTWDAKVRRWAMRYLSELSESDLEQFMRALTLSRNMPFSAVSKPRPLPKRSGRTIQMYRYEAQI